MVRLVVACLLFVAQSFGSLLLAQSPSPTPDHSPVIQKELRVGVVPFPPLVVSLPENTWDGIGIQVWRELADSLEWKYQFVRFDNHVDLVKGLETGQIDLCIPSMPVSTLAPQDIDFSQPFFASEYALAVSPHSWRVTWFNSLQALWNAGVAELALFLVLLLVIAGILIWLCERRQNPGEFGGTFLEGFGHGIWWSAVTMTTVGYGDKSPRTFLGRVVAFVLMFLGFMLLSVFVSTLVSNLSSHFRTDINVDRALHELRVGVMAKSPAGEFLAARSVPARQFQSVTEMGQAFARGQIDAIFSDSAHLQRANWDIVGIHPILLSQSTGSNWYAFAFKRESLLAAPLNHAILDFIQTPRWNQIISMDNNNTYQMPATW